MVFSQQVPRYRVIRLAVLLVICISSVALSYWRGAGTGAAAGGAATASAVVIAPAPAGADLYPGGQANVLLTIANPNPFSVRLGSLSLDTSRGTGGFAVDAGHAACGLSALSFATQSASWSVGPRVGSSNGSLSVTLPGALSMTTGAVSACQGASFTVYLVAGA